MGGGGDRESETTVKRDELNTFAHYCMRSPHFSFAFYRTFLSGWFSCSAHIFHSAVTFAPQLVSYHTATPNPSLSLSVASEEWIENRISLKNSETNPLATTTTTTTTTSTTSTMKPTIIWFAIGANRHTVV